jgi:tripartite-type tricarboxylate transporter receptor subunit TctC
MRLHRRTLLAGAALLPLPAYAQTWPARPIRMVVPFAPGGTTDIVARILSQQMSERLGQPVVVENRPGAGATLASQQVAQAAPDGYTLVISNSASHGISPSLFRNVRYDAMTDFSHIALAATTSTAVLVNPRYEAQTIQALIALGRSRPNGLDYAISGHGTSTHLAGIRMGMVGGFKMNPIPYRGSGPALTDVIAGNVGLMVDGLPSCIGFIRDGSLKALAVADAQRNRFLPALPTLIEAGLPGVTSYSWFGVSGPKDLPAPIVERLNTEIRAILQLPTIRQRYTELTADAPDLTPAQYAAFISEELRVWGEVVRASGATAE